MTSRIATILLLLVLLTACQPATPPAQTPTPRATLPPILVPTDTPGPTPVPTHTPYPPLVEQVPYIMYSKNGDTGPFILMDANMQRLNFLELSDGRMALGFTPNLQNVISPDGKWLVVYTGSTDAPYDLTLNLMSLSDGSIHPVAPILSDEFPRNREMVLEYYIGLGLNDNLEFFQDVYLNPHLFVGWSPDGRYLAYTGWADGPSNDLYSYDLQTGNIQRLTNDLLITMFFDWSPDGKCLMVRNIIQLADLFGDALSLVWADGTTPQESPVLEKGINMWEIGWVSSHEYLVADMGHNLYTRLRKLDILTGTASILWENPFDQLETDQQDSVILIRGFLYGQDYDATETPILLGFDGQQTILTEPVDSILGFHEGIDPYFVGIHDGQLVSIKPSGTVEYLGVKVGNRPYIKISPDGNWYVLHSFENEFYDDIPQSLALYSADNKLIREFTGLYPNGVMWNDDSSGFLVVTHNELYLVTLPDGELKVVDQCAPDEIDCFISFDFIAFIP